MSTEGAIAFYLPSLCGGGAERVVVNLAQGITERGIRVDLVLAAAEGPLLDQVPPTVRVVDLHAPRVLRSLAPLAGYLRRERPRVLVSSMGHANLIAIWAAKLAGGVAPLIVTEHNTLSQETQRQSRAGRQTLAASVAARSTHGPPRSSPCRAAQPTTWLARPDCPGTGSRWSTTR